MTIQTKSKDASPSSPTRDWPMVTVVVATRDREQLLRRAVASIFDQDYPGTLECIVVFDQSDIKAPDVDTSAQRILRVIANTRAPGLAGARNSGVLAGSGEFVAFCDDDDEWLPAKLRLQIECFARHPESSLISSGIEVQYRNRHVRRLPARELLTLSDLLRSRAMEVHPSTYLARREVVLSSIGLVDEGIPGSYAEDYEWLLRAAKVGPIRCVEDALTRVHWHQTSWFAGRWETIISALGYLLDRYPEFQNSPEGLARIYGQLAFAHAAAGRRAESLRWVRRTVARNWRERRAYIALAVVLRVFKAQTVMRMANSIGRGI